MEQKYFQFNTVIYIKMKRYIQFDTLLQYIIHFYFVDSVSFQHFH